MDIKVHSVYKHFKGALVYVYDIALDSETQKEMVVYRHLGDDKLWIRDKEMFLSNVDKKKYPNVKQEKRFELYGENLND